MELNIFERLAAERASRRSNHVRLLQLAYQILSRFGTNSRGRRQHPRRQGLAKDGVSCRLRFMNFDDFRNLKAI
jgi:hypothetical protein